MIIKRTLMKVLKNIKGSFFIAILALIVSCDKDFEDLNTNPNEPTIANANYLFTESLAQGAGQFSTGIHTEIWTLMNWDMHMADINGITSAGNEYAYSNDWNDELWKELYARVLLPVNDVIKITKDDPYLVSKWAMAKIWKVYISHRITDLWGDIPYSDALNGVNENGNPILAPKYDNQKDIYTDLIADLKNAADAIDQSKPSFDQADILYQGSHEKWIKFANSLRLRLAMRISNADPVLAQQVVSELMTEDNFISSNSEGAHFQFVSNHKHPFFDLYESGQGMRNPSHFFIELLKSMNDPRLEVYAELTESSIVLGTEPYVGVPNLMTSVELNTLGINMFTASEVGSYFLDINTAGTTFSYAEICFLKAEAAHKAWGGSQTTEDYYNEGVRAAMELLGVHDTSITNYLAGATAFDGSLEMIITQKWISFTYRDAYESYAELRRTGFPKLKNYDGSLLDMNNLPQRFKYPPSEISLNWENVSAVGLGIDETTSKVWWDD